MLFLTNFHRVWCPLILMSAGFGLKASPWFATFVEQRGINQLIVPIGINVEGVANVVIWLGLAKMHGDTPIFITNSLILLQQGLPQGKQFFLSNKLGSFLIKITLNELWAARNLDTFKSKWPSVRTIIAKIKAHMSPHQCGLSYFPGPRVFQVLDPSWRAVFLCKPEVNYPHLIHSS